MAPTIKTWAFVVGINDYPAKTGQRQLKGAVADAADFADWALHERGGGVPHERLFFWTHPAPEPKEISPALAEYLKKPTPWWDPDEPENTPDFDVAPKVLTVTVTALEAGKGGAAAAFEEEGETLRRAFVFFAGHGVLSRVIGELADPQTCFVMGDFRPNLTVAIGLLPCENFRRTLLANGFHQVIMFLDCCRGQAPNVTMPTQQINAPNIVLPTKLTYLVGNAAQLGEPAFETQDAPVRGAFTKTLMQGLRTHRTDPGQTLSLDNLRQWVKSNIKAAAHPNSQTPSLDGKPDDAWELLAEGPPITEIAGPAGLAHEPGAAVGVAQSLAGIVVDTSALPQDAMLQLSDGKGLAVGAPIAAAVGSVTIPDVPTGRFYGLDVIGANRSIGVDHKGPGDTHVAF